MAKVATWLILGFVAFVSRLIRAEEQGLDYEKIKCDLKTWMDNGVPCKDCAVDGHDAYAKNGNGPLLVRLGWHCSGTYSSVDGTGGCDGARLRFKPESEDPENKGLTEAMLQLNDFVDEYGPYEGLTFADLYTLAGSVAVENMGGAVVPWRPGRSDATDGSTSPANGRLPRADGDASHVRDVFERLGFNESQTVALIGAHTLGCTHVQNSGYMGCWMPGEKHRQFDNNFFKFLLEEDYMKEVVPESGKERFTLARDKSLVMLPADIALTKDDAYKEYVDAYAKDNQLFKAAFSQAYHQLLELGTRLDGPLYDKPLSEICRPVKRNHAATTTTGGGKVVALPFMLLIPMFL